MPQLHPRLFLGFTQALDFPVGYKGSYNPLGKDISYAKCTQHSVGKQTICGRGGCQSKQGATVTIATIAKIHI